MDGYLRGTDFLVAGSKPRQVAFAVLQDVHAGNLKSHYAFYISIGTSRRRAWPASVRTLVLRCLQRVHTFVERRCDRGGIAYQLTAEI